MCNEKSFKQFTTKKSRYAMQYNLFEFLFTKKNLAQYTQLMTCK